MSKLNRLVGYRHGDLINLLVKFRIQGLFKDKLCPCLPSPCPPLPHHKSHAKKKKNKLLLCKLLLPYYRVHDRLDWSLVLFVILGVLCRICIPVSSERKLLLNLIFFVLSLCLGHNWHEFVAAWGWFRDHGQVKNCVIFCCFSYLMVHHPLRRHQQ